MRENRDSEAAINSELAIGIDIQLMKIDLNEDLMGWNGRGKFLAANIPLKMIWEIFLHFL